jgi:hypothetical protein
MVAVVFLTASSKCQELLCSRSRLFLQTRQLLTIHYHSSLFDSACPLQCRQWFITFRLETGCLHNNGALSDRMLPNQMVWWIQIRVSFIVTTIFKVYIHRGKKNALRIKLMTKSYLKFISVWNYLISYVLLNFFTSIQFFVIFSINIQEVCYALVNLFARKFCSVKLQNFVLASCYQV